MSKRISHIKRIFKNNESTSDTWIDVERIDELWLVSTGAQRSHWIFDWDGFNEATAAKKKISDPNDPANSVEVPVRTLIHVTAPHSASEHSFRNDKENRSRETHSRKIYHHKIKESYLQSGQPPRDPVDYLNSLGQQDKSQYVEVEILDSYWTAEDEALGWWRHRRNFSVQKQKKNWIPTNTAAPPAH